MKLHQLNISAYYSMYLQVIILFSSSYLWSQFAIPTNALGSEGDGLALLEFKRGIVSDPFGVLRSWNDSTDFCNWKGVTCSRRHKRVTVLSLYEHNLQGSISPHIGNLSFLKLIDLSNNSFSGEIPKEVGQLFRLQYFYLTNNTLTGEIPAQLSNCSELREIDFARNRLAGRIPSELGYFAKLELFQLGANNLTGRVPTSIGNLSSLVHFSVPYNNLEGNIPKEIGHLKSLSILAVAANKFSGELPSSLYNLSSITIISTASNHFNGTLPANIGLTLPNLEWLAISSNELSGPIPISLSNASKLQAVVLSTNNFVGAVPRDLGKLVDLWWLGFGSNYLGSNSSDDLNFLTSLKNISQLQILDFGGNQFGGVLPASIANLSTTLTKLFLGGNQISGFVPTILEKYTNLRVLDMARNLFTGVIPSSFGMLQNVQGMDLRKNKLFGEIPSSFGNLTQLIELYLSENMFNGSIPSSIGNCKYLQYLDISQNNLTGAIPKEVTDLSSLSLLLNLSYNSLSGNLPVEVGNLKNINALDVSENNLVGEIPTTIGDCKSLEYLNLQGNSFQGVIPSSLASLKGLSHLDLSHNKLSGNIPKDLQTLPFLVYFNASFNELEGEVPTKGVFRNASSISVMENSKLCGGIPELQLPACTTARATKHGLSHSLKLAIIISCVVLVLLTLASFLALYSKRNSKKKPSPMLSTKDLEPGHLPKVSYKMLYEGTAGFSLDNLVGSGSFGSVYRGILGQDERVVAIKVIHLQQSGASKSFMSECMALRNIRHRNLVKIITSCSSLDYQGNEFKALVFEFIANSSLEEWLHVDGENSSRNLNFLQRLSVAIDVASALQYLHFECEPPVIHCDLKPSNILLDNDMVAHVGDFGLARILSTTNGIPRSQTSTIGLKGSIGYAAPGRSLPFFLIFFLELLKILSIYPRKHTIQKAHKNLFCFFF
ncbi:GPCR kinase [Parasponia andersonii]|uniref:non-specific serine/threonine protein kinase n=1 Tax=Parasponia andersonii TaxID=3476 RepID=A0A2P5D4L8_PARAD|nr:GPCR kinase [Parasponia andersonii]